jgi:hypothetical protein
VKVTFASLAVVFSCESFKVASCKFMRKLVIGFGVIALLAGSLNAAGFSLVGFGAPTTGGGVLPESDLNCRKGYPPGDLRLARANKNTRIIE